MSEEGGILPSMAINQPEDSYDEMGNEKRVHLRFVQANVISVIILVIIETIVVVGNIYELYFYVFIPAIFWLVFYVLSIIGLVKRNSFCLFTVLFIILLIKIS